MSVSFLMSVLFVVIQFPLLVNFCAMAPFMLYFVHLASVSVFQDYSITSSDVQAMYSYFAI